MTSALPDLSVVFITYNRLSTLRPTLESFLANTDYPRQLLQLIVADDGSPENMRREIRAMPFDVFAFAGRRSGLGANANRGLAAATGDYVLQLQDDWECLGPPDYLRRALAAMQAAPEIGMIILRPHPAQLAVREHKLIGRDTIRLYGNDPSRKIKVVGQHAYTDWPHLKRRAFSDALGPYKEVPRMWETELDFSQRVNRQTQFYVADIVAMNAFRHIGGEFSFNNGPCRARCARTLERVAAGRAALHAWRRIKGAIAERQPPKAH